MFMFPWMWKSSFSCKLTTYNTVVAMATMASMHISCASRVAWERGERSDGHGSTGHAPWAGIGGFYMFIFGWDFLINYFRLFWMCFSSSPQGGIWLNMLMSPHKWHQINNHRKKYSCTNCNCLIHVCSFGPCVLVHYFTLFHRHWRNACNLN